MNEKPFVSVIIPAYNESHKLDACLPTVFSQTYSHFEVIMIDDGSHDDTADKAQRIANEYEVSFTLIQQHNQGAAAARNVGWRKAKGDIIAFIDIGCYADINWLAELVNAIGDAGAVGGTIKLTAEYNALTRYAQAARHYRHRVSEEGVEYLITANVAFSIETLRAIDGFHERHSVGGEDVDISYRASKAGYKLCVTPDAVVEHGDAENKLKPFAIKFFRRGYALYFYAETWQKLGYRRNPMWEIIRHIGAVVLGPYLALRYAARRRWQDFPAYWLFIVVEHISFSAGIMYAFRKQDQYY